jgi:uncharacterized MAPEG superfamily protein
MWTQMQRTERPRLEGLKMPDFLAPYSSVVVAYAAMAVLFLVQVLVADGASVSAGHVPGTPVTGGHESFLFRATRAHANTNENLTFFLLASLTAILAGASPRWSAIFAWCFVTARLVHMVAYYTDVRMVRSAAFAVGLIATASLVVLAVVALA